LLVVDDIADSFDYKNKYAIIQYLKDIAEEESPPPSSFGSKGKCRRFHVISALPHEADINSRHCGAHARPSLQRRSGTMEDLENAIATAIRRAPWNKVS
jgi:hypothetical protein